jgi:hypothetical protein
MNEKQQALVDAADETVELFQRATTLGAVAAVVERIFALHWEIVQELLRLRAKIELRRRQRERCDNN